MDKYEFRLRGDNKIIEVLVIEARGEAHAGTIGDIFTMRVKMLGGTGVITIGQLLGMAAHIEGRGIVAEYVQANDGVTAWASTQKAHDLHQNLCAFLRIDENRLRVATPDVGGGFGPKGTYYPEYANLSVASRLLGRPVKWIEDRRENFHVTHQERDQYWDMEIAVDADGRILGLRGQLIQLSLAFLEIVESRIRQGRNRQAGGQKPRHAADHRGFQLMIPHLQSPFLSAFRAIRLQGPSNPVAKVRSSFLRNRP